MQTIKIEEVEKLLSKKIRKEAISIGFDVAEEFTGVCILKTDNDNIYIEDLQKIVTNKKDDIKHRIDYFIDALKKFKQDLEKYKDNYKIVIVEQPWLGLNPKVFEALVTFKTLTYVSFKKECDYIDFVSASTARAEIAFNKNKQIEVGNVVIEKISRGKNKGKPKKVDIKKLVKDYLKTALSIEIEDSDKADGFVLALYGLLK